MLIGMGQLESFAGAQRRAALRKIRFLWARETGERVLCLQYATGTYFQSLSLICHTTPTGGCQKTIRIQSERVPSLPDSLTSLPLARRGKTLST